MKKLKTLILIMSSTFFFFTNQNVQSQDFGADVVSSYVWRGTQFGQGVHIQPWMTIGSGGFEGGIWGSFPATAAGGGDELDLYVSYDFGPLAITVTNYTFPDGTGNYGEGTGLFDGDMEIALSTELGSVSLLGGYFPDLEALYIEAGFPLGPVDFAIGYGSDGKDPFYAGGDSGIVNLSFGGSKDIKITDDYSLPVSGSFVYNPNAEAAFLVFGLSF